MRKRKGAGRQPVIARSDPRWAPERFFRLAGSVKLGGICLAVCGAALVLALPWCFAKQKPPATRTISGMVLDASGHGIAGASVMLINLKTHRSNAIYSGANGDYNFSGLDPLVDFDIQAKYKGMASEVRRVSSFDPRLQIVVNLTVAPLKSRPPS